MIINFPTGIDEITGPHLTQWDYGQKLEIYGLNLPQETQVHFCDKSCEKAIVRIASKVIDDAYEETSHSEVFVPDALLENKWDVHAFIFINSYEEACGVTAETTGTFYTRAGSEGSYTYTAVTLPEEYVAGTTYYQSCGRTTKQITMPVTPRLEPDVLTPERSEVDDFLGEALARISQAAEVIEEQAYNSSRIYNIYDGQLYDMWIGSEQDYDDLTPEEKERINTLHIYDNHLQQKLEDGTITVAAAAAAEEAEKASKDADGLSIAGNYLRAVEKTVVAGGLELVNDEQVPFYVGNLETVGTFMFVFEEEASGLTTAIATFYGAGSFTDIKITDEIYVTVLWGTDTFGLTAQGIPLSSTLKLKAAKKIINL